MGCLSVAGLPRAVCRRYPFYTLGCRETMWVKFLVLGNKPMARTGRRTNDLQIWKSLTTKPPRPQNVQGSNFEIFIKTFIFKTGTCTRQLNASCINYTFSFHLKLNWLRCLINNYSPKWRWIVVNICRATRRWGNHLPLFTDAKVNNCLSTYQTSG